jgi:hypothetical protein
LLTLDGWSNRNPKGFYVVTAQWVDASSMSTKSALLTIIDVACGTGVGARVGVALFEHLKRMGRDVLTRVLNVTSDNGSDTVSAVKRLFQLIKNFVSYEQMRQANHVRCADHLIQLGVLLVLKHIKTTNEELREALIKIRRGEVMRQEYPIVAASTGLASNEPTHADSPTRWNSTHEMNADVSNKRVALDHILERFKTDIGCDSALSDDQWRAVDGVANFLRVPRQVVENLAADLNPTLHLVPK